MYRNLFVLAAAIMLSAPLGIARAQMPTSTSPDNTGVNARDRSDFAVTADRQSNNKADIHLAARVRRAIVKDKSLSTTAHNVKVVCNNGQVTLRGPVKSDQEKTRIGQDAQAIAGVNSVDNQLEIIGPQARGDTQ
jgi:hypothetical protein